jgi:hypothetical protein
MVLCLDYSVLELNHPRSILFQTMLINSEDLCVPNILDPIAVFGKYRSHLTSLLILRRVANEEGDLEITSLCCPSVA